MHEEVNGEAVNKKNDGGVEGGGGAAVWEKRGGDVREGRG